MAQTNVMVSYTPARPLAERPDAVRRVGEPRRKAMLVGGLLAGGAAFALGQFITADGSPREKNFQPLRSATIGPVEPRVPSRLPPSAPPLVTPTKPLPYLAIVRDVAPTPPAAPPVRQLTTRVERPVQPAAQPRNEPPLVDGGQEAQPALAADLAPTAEAPPAAGLRRDLEGFLEDRGHVLTVPEPGQLVAATGELVADGAGVDLAAGAVTQESIEGTARPAVELVEAPPSPTMAPVARAPEPTPVVPDEPPARIVEAAPTVAPARLAATGMGAVERVPTVATVDNPPLYVQSYPVAVVNGEPLGAVTTRDFSDGSVAVHLRALLSLVKLRLPQTEFARFDASAAADRFVTLEDLRAAGIDAHLDPRNGRLSITAR